MSLTKSLTRIGRYRIVRVEGNRKEVTVGKVIVPGFCGVIEVKIVDSLSKDAKSSDKGGDTEQAED